MTRASAQELAHMLSDEEEATSSAEDEGFWPPQTQSSGNKRIFAISGVVVLAATAMLGTITLRGGSSIDEMMDDVAAPLERATAKALWPQWMPAGKDDTPRALRHLQEQESHLTQKCKDVLTKVEQDVMNATLSVINACTPDPSADACTEAAQKAAEAAEKITKLMAGKCDLKGYMLCNISEVDGGVVETASGCIPDVCKPRNILLDTMDDRDSFNAGCANCTLEIACQGHDVVTEAMAKSAKAIKGDDVTETIANSAQAIKGDDVTETIANSAQVTNTTEDVVVD